jgi:hypothetical protein
MGDTPDATPLAEIRDAIQDHLDGVAIQAGKLLVRIETLAAERDAAIARAEAAEAERDALRVVARAAQNVAAWKEPIQMIAPELGGSLRAIWVLEAALDALPPGSLEDGGKLG